MSANRPNRLRAGQYGLLCAVLIGICAANSAHADVASVDCTTPRQLEAALLQERDCMKDAGFMHNLGRLFNEAGLYGEALDSLEAAIMLEPERWAAHLDYAEALEATGNRLSAISLLTGLGDNPVVDPVLRARARQRLARQIVPPPPSRSTVLSFSAGYDDNLLGVTRYNAMELTLPTGVLPVVIEDSQQRGGRFARLDVNHEGDLHVSDTARWLYGVFASQRWSVDYRPADQAQVGVRIERAPTQEAGVYGVGVSQQLARGGERIVNQWQLGAGLEWNNALAGVPCRTRVGGELQGARYPGYNLFDGRYAGVFTHWVCPEQQLQVQLRAGVDRPDHSERPGGQQRQLSVRISRYFSIGNGILAAEYDYFRQLDSKGYSVLLDNNAPRTLTRNIYRVEYRWNAGALSPYIGFEWLDQTANLPLFSPRNRIVTLGVRQLW